jgi:hypothetical protein
MSNSGFFIFLSTIKPNNKNFRLAKGKWLLRSSKLATMQEAS